MTDSNHPALVDSLRRFLVEDAQLNGTEIDPGTDLFKAGILDSLRILSLVTFIEQEFAVTLDYEDLTEENFQSLERLSSLVASKGGAPA